MMSTDSASQSKGVSLAGGGAAAANCWQRQMESGLMERLRKTKKVSLRMRLRTLLVLSSCFSTWKVVNSSRLTTRKFPNNTTKFLPTDTTSDSAGKVLISYCRRAPKMRMAKLMQQQANLCAFFYQYPAYNCNQSISSASGPAHTLMCCPYSAVGEQQVQNLKNNLPNNPREYFFRKLSRDSSSLNVTKTKSSRFSLFFSLDRIALISSFLTRISLVMDVMYSLAFLRFLAIKAVFLSLQTAFRHYTYYLTLQVNSTFSMGYCLNFSLISSADAFRETLVSMTLRSLSFLLRLRTQYLLFLRQPRTKRMRRVKSIKKRKRISRRNSMKPIQTVQTIQSDGEVKRKETV